MVTPTPSKQSKPATSKYWRLTYSLEGGRRRVQSWTFLTVAEALDHCRLLNLSTFRLEDLQTNVH